MRLSNRINPDQVPWPVWFLSRLGLAFLRAGVPRSWCENFVAESCFWIGQAGWTWREIVATLRGFKGGLHLAESILLPAQPSPRDRAFFYFLAGIIK